ncbi:MAG: DHHA1 domain-containing protein, partial [Bacillota bacterium]|nr:DHHA1 domain-containing protein [Bacillota bacterium]
GVNAGFHMGADYVTIDIDIKDLTEEMIKKAEIEANSYLYRNEEIKTYFLTKEEALKLPLRKEIKAEGRIRIVQMGTVDYSACCGTPVNRTGEVGIIKILKSEKYKGMTRIYFVCGKRALSDYIKKQDILTELGRSLSTDENGIIKIVNNQNEEIFNLKKQLIELNKGLAKIEAAELVKNSLNKKVIKLYEDKNFDYVQNVYECLKDDELILIIGSLSDKKLIYAQNGSFSVDCGKIYKEKVKQFGGKGGGNSKRAQAAFENAEDIKKFAEILNEI